MYRRHKDGADAEQFACRYLRRQGLKLLERNYQSRHGEIDLIMTDRDCLVFVEVRYRRDTDIITPLESIDHRKQQRLRRTAEHYLRLTGQSFTRTCRFDAVGVTGVGKDARIEWVSDAF